MTAGDGERYDVVVVGYGYAGAFAAIEAADAGARVLLLEKSAMPGGISICSAGGVRTATDADKAFAYLKATCGGKTPDPVLRQLASGMTEVHDRLSELARGTGGACREPALAGELSVSGKRNLRLHLCRGDRRL